MLNTNLFFVFQREDYVVEGISYPKFSTGVDVHSLNAKIAAWCYVT